MNRRERRAGLAFARKTQDEWHAFERVVLAPQAIANRKTPPRSCWRNNVYSVQIFARATADGEALQLAIRRHDSEEVLGWSDLQRIKNEIAGADRVAIEVYPVDDDVVDEANMRHLFVLPVGSKAPFTIRGRRE